jgi:hypothetical protein
MVMTMGFRSYVQIVGNAASQSVDRAFTKFLDKNINIPAGTRSRASVSHNHVRDILVDESYEDDEFPRILRDQDADFLGGSFSRHTKIWPLDDIDIYIPIDGTRLIYSTGSRKLPYTVVSDDSSLESPLLIGGDRWMEGTSLSSKKLIDGFANVLRRTYPSTTRVRRAGEAVNIETTSFGFDIVPCFLLRPHNPIEFEFYVIPDGEDGWIHTNPRIDDHVSLELQRNNNKTHRPAVKLVKWWNENRFGDKFDSYYIELAIMRSVQKLNGSGLFHVSVAEAVAHAFAGLASAADGGDLASWIRTAPAVEVSKLTLSERIDLALAAQTANAAFAKERAGDLQGAHKEWSSVFGDLFSPS